MARGRAAGRARREALEEAGEAWVREALELPPAPAWLVAQLLLEVPEGAQPRPRSHPAT